MTNIFENNVEEYLSGQSNPYQTIKNGLNKPLAVVLDKKGWLYVANTGDDTVVKFAPGSTKPAKRKIEGFYYPESIAYYPPLLP